MLFAASRALRPCRRTPTWRRINVAVIPGPGTPVVIGVLGNPIYQAEESRTSKREIGSSSPRCCRRHDALRPLPGAADVRAARPGFELTPHLAPCSSPRVSRTFSMRIPAGLEVAARLRAAGWRLDASIGLQPHVRSRQPGHGCRHVRRRRAVPSMALRSRQARPPGPRPTWRCFAQERCAHSACPPTRAERARRVEADRIPLGKG